MAENKGLPVSGYRPQSDENVKAVNGMKAAEERILRTIDELKSNPDIDQRWLSIGVTHLEQGFMAVNRAIFKPGRVRLAEDAADDGND